MAFNAYIVEAVRTPVGKRNGALKQWHPADLGAQVVNAVVDRAGIPPEAVDDVIVGCVSQVGAQSGNLGRSVVLSSKLPITVPGVTVDRQCGSGQQAVHFAAQAVMSGTQDVVIAAGVEVMSLVPIGSAVVTGFKEGLGHPFWSQEMKAKYPGVEFSQFTGAELLAKKHGVSREELDQFAVLSHQRAAEATEAGRFKKEIVPVKGVVNGKELLVHHDEGFRKDTSLEKLKKLKLLDEKDGRHTAATASQISDGAAALLIVNERALLKYKLVPRAKIAALALAGDDPVVMLGGPIPATRNLLKKSGLKIEDIDIFEVNEAFGAVPLAFAKELKVDLQKVNVNGGAQALGHPLGATGCKLMTTLLHELERRNAKYGVQAICEGGGTANATLVERISAEQAQKLLGQLKSKL